MENLPMNKKNNLFFKIKLFFEKLFTRKKYSTEKSASTTDAPTMEQRSCFKVDIKIDGKQEEVLRKIEEQNKKNQLLEKFARNPELLDELSMEELIKLDKMYDEEILKMNTKSN